ncbi:MAG TPA: hypothetical protein VFA59_02190, partial [Vicinamibacterales bacterium]|nr:hypothetical protein [Vicinamibacterales bacterium]
MLFAVLLDDLKSYQSTFDHLVDVAYQYGPFLFAMLFLVGITIWAQKKHDEICHQSPPANPKDISLYRQIYVASFAFGLCLV